MEKTILITGTSSGIGWTTSHYLKKRGWRVFATARKKEDVKRLTTEGFEAFHLDVNDSSQIRDVVGAILELTEGKLFGLCNNAGYALPGALEDIGREELRAQFETNVFGLQELTNCVLPIMRKQGYGRIIHISSVLGLISLPFRGAYNASKYAVEGLGDTLRLELRNTDIHVSLIEPGPILSRFRENALSQYEVHINPQESFFRNTYGNFLKNFKENKATQFGAKPEIVAKKILHALESRRPKTHYYVTLPTYLFVGLKRLLPQRVLDLILAKIAEQEIKYSTM
jgi:short-subunit dehydrogenase